MVVFVSDTKYYLIFVITLRQSVAYHLAFHCIQILVVCGVYLKNPFTEKAFNLRYVIRTNAIKRKNKQKCEHANTIIVYKKSKSKKGLMH